MQQEQIFKYETMYIARNPQLNLALKGDKNSTQPLQHSVLKSNTLLLSRR